MDRLVAPEWATGCPSTIVAWRYGSVRAAAGRVSTRALGHSWRRPFLVRILVHVFFFVDFVRLTFFYHLHFCFLFFNPNCQHAKFIPKLFLRCPWLFRWTVVLFRRIRTFSQLFRFGFIPGNSGIRQIVEKFNADGSLMGRTNLKIFIFINLCGKNNVRNCDLLQSDFFALWWNLEKDEAPKRCDFLRLRNMLLKATFFPSS